MAKEGKVAGAASKASTLASLANSIKPAMFKNGFDVNNLVKSAATVSLFASRGRLFKKSFRLTTIGGLYPPLNGAATRLGNTISVAAIKEALSTAV